MSQLTSLWTAVRLDRVKSETRLLFVIHTNKKRCISTSCLYVYDLIFTLSLPPGDVSIGIKCAPGVVGPAEADIDFDIIKNDNDTFTVKYTPPGPGQYTIMVLFADQVRSLNA